MLHRDQPVSDRRLRVPLFSRCRCCWCGVSQRAGDVARNLPLVMWMIRGKVADSDTAAQKLQQAQLQNPEFDSAYSMNSGFPSEENSGFFPESGFYEPRFWFTDTR